MYFLHFSLWKNFFQPHIHTLKFTTFIGEPTLGIPADKSMFSYGYIRIVGHTKISIFMSNHLFSLKNKTIWTVQTHHTEQDEYLIEDIPLQLRVRTDKIRIPLHKFRICK